VCRIEVDGDLWKRFLDLGEELEIADPGQGGWVGQGKLLER
jgi:hypothetical protein